MYLLYRAGGYPAQATLWRWLAGGQVRLLGLAELEINRVAVLMAKYRDRPMDLADASLVVIAERLGLRQVFTRAARGLFVAISVSRSYSFTSIFQS